MMGFLERRDAIGTAQRESDVVPAFQQALAAEGIDAEFEAKT
jgi:hypothetical protein